MPSLFPRLINIPQANSAGNAFEEISISGSNLILQTNNSGVLYGNKLVPSASYALTASYLNVSYCLTTSCITTSQLYSNYISGNVLVAPSITGSVFGTASWADYAVTASYAMNSNIAPSPITPGATEVMVYNGTDETINKGQAVRFVNGTYNYLIVDFAVAHKHNPTNEYQHSIIGIAKESIASGETGQVTTKGFVKDLNTSQFLDGDILYVKPAISGVFSSGSLTSTRPTPPDDIIKVGYVSVSDPWNGAIYVDIINSIGFEDIVNISSSTTPLNNSILIYNSSSKVWVDKVYDVYWELTGSNLYYPDGNVGVGNINPSYSLQVSGTIAPVEDGIFPLGDPSNRFSDLYALQTTVGAFFEVGLRTENIGKNPTGTIVVWKNGKLVPCNSDEDELVMGVIKEGKDEPIILGAETILVTGLVKEGDYIVTSSKIGHGKAVKIKKFFKKNIFGKVIAQALESSNQDSKLIKAMIRKM